jgi:hypothetical protein
MRDQPLRQWCGYTHTTRLYSLAGMLSKHSISNSLSDPNGLPDANEKPRYPGSAERFADF